MLEENDKNGKVNGGKFFSLVRIPVYCTIFGGIMWFGAITYQVQLHEREILRRERYFEEFIELRQLVLIMRAEQDSRKSVVSNIENLKDKVSRLERVLENHIDNDLEVYKKKSN